MFKYLIFFLLITLSISSNAKTNWYCAHPELCNLFQEIIDENQISDLAIYNVVQLSGDPHEYEPKSIEIKNLIKVNNLIIGPKELNPWSTKINYQRIKNKNYKQIELTLSTDDLKNYSYSTNESISHFWLYPKIYCKFKNSLITYLKNDDHPKLKISICDNSEIETKLKKTIANLHFSIIVTHDALVPLLKTLSPTTQNIVSLKGSGHHEELNSAAIKNLYKALSDKRVIWIKEKNISIPTNISNKIRANDLVIELDTSSTKRKSPFSVLTELEAQLASIANKAYE
jgi:hypothetical protein